MRVLALLGLGLLVASWTNPQETPRGLVTVHAFVQASNAADQPSLSRDDFEVLSDRQPRPIETFSTAVAPVAVVVLLDMTRSMTTIRVIGGGAVHDPDTLRAAVEALAVELKDGDRARIGSIAAKPTLGPAFTADRRALVKAGEVVLNTPEAERIGPSPIWDAVDSAVTVLIPEAGRKTVILVSNGRSTGNRRDGVEVTTRAANANVSVNIVTPWARSEIRVDATTVLRVRPDVLLQNIADYTGGLYLPPVVAQQSIPKTLFADIIGKMRRSYTLGFHGVADGRPHELEVRVKKPDVQVRVRKQYVVP